jgi:uronate dehydrogenase
LPLFDRLLLTGATGGLGRALRPRLVELTRNLRLSDIIQAPEPAPGTEWMRCDLADGAAVHELLRDVDAVVHLGAVSIEGPFEPILQANIRGMFHLYEAARRHGVKRIVFASSNHVIGFYRQGERIDANAPPRPDGFYGVSKAFGEQLSRFYFDRYGIETVCLRIGSSFEQPKDRRMLVTWLSYDDLFELVRRALVTPNVGHTIVYGASANRDSWWDNTQAAHLGWTPHDSSEQFRARVEAQPALPPDDAAAIFQGGVFVKAGPYPAPWTDKK